MAHKAFPQEDMYIVNKGSRGLGRNSFARTMYKIQKSNGPKCTVEIVSPVAQAVDRAKALISPKSIREMDKGSEASKKKSKHGSKVSKVVKKKSSKVNRTRKERRKKPKNNGCCAHGCFSHFWQYINK